MLLNFFLFLFLIVPQAFGLRYAPEHVGYNLNENQTATEPKHYWGEWQGHDYHPSPSNWRFPFYVLTIDRFVDGNPENNEANETVFEHNWMANQFRFGGDVAGVLSDLDYLQGFGIKGIYLTGTMMLNMPWSADGYGPLDLTLLDRHHGDIQEWRNLIDEIHRRGMYVIFDNTMATMGNLLGYGDGFTNASAPFNWNEYDYIWKDSDRRYHDFLPGNDHNASCQYPRIWEQDGYLLSQTIQNEQRGCRASEFDMYGDINGTGAYPSYINQLSRFASVQDRLREWQPDVLEKIKVMSCMQIAMLDIDGFRMDKAVQTTIDAMAEWSTYQRDCARRFGKENFLVVGEVVSDPLLSNIYVGRGKQPDQILDDPAQAVFSNNDTDPSTFIRPFGETALDAIAFHYDVYGSMTRFLGLDGPWGKLGVDWVEFWNERMLAAHDMVNANTGLFDPRHMFGTTNQDVFRWPALANGTQRQLLGLFVTTLELPGVPMVYFGEEQAYYVLENLAPDYVFGRTPFASSRAWQLHGCYNLGEELYVDMPFNSSSDGCHDDTISLDHRDPSHPLRAYLKRMFEMRNTYPVLNDGYNLTTLSTRIKDEYLRGSQGMPSPHGVWSVYRGRNAQVQDFTGIGQGNEPVWLVFSNDDHFATHHFDCSNSNATIDNGPLLSPFDEGTVVKNLFYPYEEYALEGSKFRYEIENQTETNGCMSFLELRPWDFKAWVRKSAWVEPRPVITHVVPRHDARLKSTVSINENQTITIQVEFSREMDCESIANNIVIESKTQKNVNATLNKSSAKCTIVKGESSMYPGYVATEFVFTAELQNVAHGVHTYTVVNATSANGQRTTGSRDKFMFRLGLEDNPMVFPITSNYTTDIYHTDPNTKELYVTPRAAGADLFRYSTNWGTSYSKWQQYTGDDIVVQKQSWAGTKAQEWEGEHIILQFWSRITGSSDHVQHADIDWDGKPARRWPHAWVEGEYNQWGFDDGVKNQMAQSPDGNWTFDLFTSWPSNVVINVWGMNPDGHRDKSASFGDVDRDMVLDWLPPDSIANNLVNISAGPKGSHLGYRIVVNDGNYNFALIPIGSALAQGLVMILITLVPILTAAVGVFLYIRFFYKVKFNQIGIAGQRRKAMKGFGDLFSSSTALLACDFDKPPSSRSRASSSEETDIDYARSGSIPTNFPAGVSSTARRTVLIGTMEYEIPDWNIKVKIGGLGVMATLMCNNLRHQNLIWVVPCLGDIEYPLASARRSEPMEVMILEKKHEVAVYYHVVQNITYIILDAPVFRKRVKAQPYPARMDDLESGIYYSVWNQCIAQAIDRFEPDIYHINDYHGGAAPLYLLPRAIPCCLSLHNAEFQGQWYLKSATEMRETCKIFNLSEAIVRKYVQYGEVFNLLHAAASYLRIHQGGFGAVGVSEKYSQRSAQRYPIFWGLTKIGALPNPDPTDTAPLDKELNLKDIVIDHDWESQRAEDRRKAQEWAGLTIDPKAELFIFVGRWSHQKGIDLIADVFLSILESHPSVQLISIGPVIDLHGKFAALKLNKLMEQFPGRVYSKPEFTTLPPYIFSGAEFALMPSRDEPFGLVAVEFGRKGALCVGSRVGGFGNMPGWWYTVESVSSKHLIRQFRAAISNALASEPQTRASMRAYSKLQRFPVAQWVEDLEKLHLNSIAMNTKQQEKPEIMSRLGATSRNKSRSDLVSTPTSVRSSSRNTRRSPTPNAMFENPSTTVSRSPSIADIRSAYNSPSLGGPNGTSPMQSLPDIWVGFFAQHAGPADGSNDNTALSTPRAMRTPTSPSLLSRAGTIRSMRPVSFRRLSATSISKDLTVGSPLQNVVPIFNDQKSTFYDKFSERLNNNLTAKTSVGSLCIEEYLVESEKKWFDKYHLAAMGTSPSAAPLVKSFKSLNCVEVSEKTKSMPSINLSAEYEDFFGGHQVEELHGVKRFMMRKFLRWPLYSYLLAFGQIMSANAYQLTLLTGQVGQPANKLYSLSSIYLVCAIAWWILYRRFKAIYVLAPPFFFFGCSFLILGLTIAVHDSTVVMWMHNVASAMYTVGSSASTMFFALNFGTEGGNDNEVWVFRALFIAGTQQVLIAFLWYWGSILTVVDKTESQRHISSLTVLASVAIPVAALMWSIALLLYFGLPKYYRQTPGPIPSFYRSICRRGVVLWFWIMIVLQGYWLSTNYNRNWIFLWSGKSAPGWAIMLVVLVFFVGVWSGMMIALGRLTKSHPWVIPIFAIGLGAPRWCQYMWSMSGVGYHIPWISNVALGTVISRSIWAWLGVLDALQGVGFGMILLMTLTRRHVTFTLTMSQVIGAFVTVLARLTAPNKINPARIFPNLAHDSLAVVWFWVALGCQLVICIGWFKFFRKAQLNKP